VTVALDRLLGLNIDLTAFYRFAAGQGRVGEIVRRFRGMKPPRFATVFESMVNGIACQQLSLTVGIVLLNRLATAYGAALPLKNDAVHAFPRPEDLAGVKPAKLRPLGFSRQQAQAIIELARSIIVGRFDPEELAGVTDVAAIECLCNLRRVGRWTAEYVLLRGLGRTNIFPGDDIGARNHLMRWLHLKGPIDYEGVRRRLLRWRSFAGLIYFHLLLDGLERSGHMEVRPQQERVK
jgi:DNA-3-methyladenine glycosylase II